MKLTFIITLERGLPMIRITWNNLIPPGYSTENIVKQLLEPAIFNNPELRSSIHDSIFYTKNGKTFSETLLNSTARTRFFSSHADSKNLSERMLNLLLLNTSSVENIPYNLHTFPIRREFKRKWKELLTGSELDLYKSYINLFFEEGDIASLSATLKEHTTGKGVKRDLTPIDINFKSINLNNLLNQIKPSNDEPDDLFYERLSTLSIIACVWFILENSKDNTIYQEQLLRLSQMIFNLESVPRIAKKLVPDEDTKNATEELKQIKAFIETGDYRKAGSLCEHIFLIYKEASDQVIGKALAYLINCCENGYPRPQYFSSIEDIKKEAIHYNCSYIAPKNHGVKAFIRHSIDSVDGYFTINCDKPTMISEHIFKTAPLNWKGMLSLTPEKTLKRNRHQRILLVNDDFEKNMQDALNILDFIKKESHLSDWKDLELYIRCNEDEITPLLDTALSYFTEHTFVRDLIKIYLIDEAKKSADYLFARHPHVYPLTFARNKMVPEKTIHLVLISDNPNSMYAQWLIKEAFWTLPRFHSNIHSKISVFSPDATNLCHSIIAKCPGLAKFSTIDGKEINNPYPIKIDDIEFPSISYRNASFTNRALQVELNKLSRSSDYFYYVIDSSSDLSAIHLGMQIREIAIRTAVTSEAIHKYSKSNSIIAVRCFHPDYAALTQDLIIPKEEEHSNQWFNDYHLIPFGSIDDLFSWNQLSGGIIEKVAQCIHLQYCNSPKDKDACNSNLISYFKRLYNRDSSFAAAVSLPYRLFEAGVVPNAWFIQNKDAWWNEEVRKELADAFDRQLDVELRNQLAKYEHRRWCCYQLTRGWLPANAQQVIQFMKAGVTRHVLQIAKLHPCICSWNDLFLLQSSLSDACRHKADINDYFSSFEEILPHLDKRFLKYFSFEEEYSFFQQIDYSNIEQTGDILRTSWEVE